MKRTNANSKQTEQRRNLCLARDGYVCVLCSESISGITVAEVHHNDGNSKNNPDDGSNWSLVHHACNVLESYIQKRLEVVDGQRDAPTELRIGSKMELKWIRWMIDEITINKSVTWDKARYTGALEADCSPETTKRYLMKHIVESDHPKALFKSTLDQGYNSLIKFSSTMQDYVDSCDGWK